MTRIPDSRDGWRAIGRVTRLFRHPVKSMAAQPLASASVDRYGIVGDRRVALRKRGDTSGFPWLTASKLPALVRYRVERDGAEAPVRSSMRVHTPAGDVIDCEGDGLARHVADAHGLDVELAHRTQGMFDRAGLSVITTQTIASLGKMMSLSLDVRRFRPNVVIVAESGVPFPEDEWVGATIALGDAASASRFHVTERDERCVMINFDPDTGLSAPQVLRTVVQERDNYAGVYAVPMRGGEIAIGDVAWIRS